MKTTKTNYWAKWRSEDSVPWLIQKLGAQTQPQAETEMHDLARRAPDMEWQLCIRTTVTNDLPLRIPASQPSPDSIPVHI